MHAASHEDEMFGRQVVKNASTSPAAAAAAAANRLHPAPGGFTPKSAVVS